MNDHEFEKNIRRICQNDREGLKNIYEDYCPLIFSVVSDILGNREDSEDVTSEFFIRLWDVADTYHPGKGHRAWMITIARNMAVDYGRKYRRELPVSEIFDEPRERFSAEDHICRKLSLEQALMTLKKEERQVVNLKIMGELTFREIAKLLKKPPGTVAWRYRTAMEAKKVLADEMGGTLITVAKDVKIQVEFNPGYVAGYRLIGYENRLLDKEDFNDDKVDGGEIGSGHSVTALYEIIPAGGGDSDRDTGLKYQTGSVPVDSTELLTVSLRYKAPNGSKSTLLTVPVESDSYSPDRSENLSFAAAVAEFGMVLRDSENRGNADYDTVLALAEPCIHQDTDDYKKEFLKLVEMARDQGR